MTSLYSQLRLGGKVCSICLTQSLWIPDASVQFSAVASRIEYYPGCSVTLVRRPTAAGGGEGGGGGGNHKGESAATSRARVGLWFVSRPDARSKYCRPNRDVRAGAPDFGDGTGPPRRRASSRRECDTRQHGLRGTICHLAPFCFLAPVSIRSVGQ